MLKKEQDNANTFSWESVINSFSEFKYSPVKEVIFAVYFRRYKKALRKNCAKWSDEKKIQLLLEKFEKFANSRLSRNFG